jgi:hypothetical protein
MGMCIWECRDWSIYENEIRIEMKLIVQNCIEWNQKYTTWAIHDSSSDFYNFFGENLMKSKAHLYSWLLQFFRAKFDEIKGTPIVMTLIIFLGKIWWNQRHTSFWEKFDGTSIKGLRGGAGGKKFNTATRPINHGLAYLGSALF